MKCVACACSLHAKSNFCHDCGASVIDMVAYRAAKKMREDQPRNVKARKVRANLTKKQLGRMKGLTKQAGSFLSDVPISTKTFPDPGVHRAAARLTDVLLDVMQVIRPIAEEAGDSEAVNLIDEFEERAELQEHSEEHEELDLEQELDQGREVEIDEDYDDDDDYSEETPEVEEENYDEDMKEVY